MDKGQERKASAENGEVNERDDPEAEEKCVGLDVADLKQAKQTADPESAAARDFAAIARDIYAPLLAAVDAT